MSKTHAEIMSGLMTLPKAERDAKVAELTKLCTCADCPNFTGTGETKLLFCALGKSAIIKAEKECICPACPVTPEVALKWNFYCTRGSGLQQGRKQ
jgi:hypothetical protein